MSRRLWVTAESGSTHVIDGTSGNIVASFHPEAIDDHYTQSRSSVALYQPDQSIEFAVYAVIDVVVGHGDDTPLAAGDTVEVRTNVC